MALLVETTKHQPPLFDTTLPVDPIETVEDGYTVTSWLNVQEAGAIAPLLMNEFKTAGVARVLAATDNPKKERVYGQVFTNLTAAYPERFPRVLGINALTKEQKKAIGDEPDWNNVLYVSTNKNCLSVRAIKGDFGGAAAVVSSDVLVGKVDKQTGKREVFHKLGRHDDISQAMLNDRLREIQDTLSTESEWLWLVGTTIQTPKAMLLIGRYYEAHFKPVHRLAVHQLFWRDVSLGKAQGIPQAVDLMEYFPEYLISGTAHAVTWPMMQENQHLDQGFLVDILASQTSHPTRPITAKKMDIIFKSGLPFLDGMSESVRLPASKVPALENAMSQWSSDSRD